MSHKCHCFQSHYKPRVGERGEGREGLFLVSINMCISCFSKQLLQRKIVNILVRISPK